MKEERLASAGVSSVLSALVLAAVGHFVGNQTLMYVALAFLILGIFLVGMFDLPEDDGDGGPPSADDLE